MLLQKFRSKLLTGHSHHEVLHTSNLPSIFCNDDAARCVCPPDGLASKQVPGITYIPSNVSLYVVVRLVRTLILLRE